MFKSNYFCTSLGILNNKSENFISIHSKSEQIKIRNIPNRYMQNIYLNTCTSLFVIINLIVTASSWDNRIVDISPEFDTSGQWERRERRCWTSTRRAWSTSAPGSSPPTFQGSLDTSSLRLIKIPTSRRWEHYLRYTEILLCLRYGPNW